MMTYVIEQCGDKWCLYDANKTRILGKHDTRELAAKQEQAIKVQEGYTIKDREIFSTGVHNGDKYTDSDLEEMVAAFNSLDFLPAIKLGHSRDIGAPAYGYLNNIRKIGGKLIADLIDLPKEIYDAILSKRYGRVSAEVFWNLSRAGKTYKRAIGALALLGQEIPGVAGLKPLYEHNLLDSTAKCYDFDVDGSLKIVEKEDENMPELKELQAKIEEMSRNFTALNDQLDKQTKRADALEAQNNQYKANIDRLSTDAHSNKVKEKVSKVSIPALRDYFGAMYDVALASGQKVKYYSTSEKKEVDSNIVEVLDKVVEFVNSKAAKLFSTVNTGSDSTKTESTMDDAAEIGAEVDKRTNEYMSKNKGVSYGAAMVAVLNSDPELKVAYSATQN